LLKSARGQLESGVRSQNGGGAGAEHAADFFEHVVQTVRQSLCSIGRRTASSLSLNRILSPEQLIQLDKLYQSVVTAFDHLVVAVGLKIAA
jgi:hypothetical protein